MEFLVCSSSLRRLRFMHWMICSVNSLFSVLYYFRIFIAFNYVFEKDLMPIGWQTAWSGLTRLVYSANTQNRPKGS